MTGSHSQAGLSKITGSPFAERELEIPAVGGQATLMATPFEEILNEAFEFVPTEAIANAFSLHPLERIKEDSESDMTKTDWDKFEGDNAEAFERVP